MTGLWNVWDIRADPKKLWEGIRHTPDDRGNTARNERIQRNAEIIRENTVIISLSPCCSRFYPGAQPLGI